MRFSVWFKEWIRAFCRLMSFDYKKRKSISQRRRERAKRLKAKRSNAILYRIKKKYKKRRRPARNRRMIRSISDFIGVSLGILFLPFGLFDWGRKSVGARRASRGNGAVRNSTKASNPAASRTKKTSSATAKNQTEGRSSHTADQAPITHTATEPTETANAEPTRSVESTEPEASPTAEEAPTVTEPDENTPKSTPKNEKDQYIRKRMRIEDPHSCDKAVLDTLRVGSYIDLEAESDHPCDKDAVKLLFGGQRIGYIAKNDRMAFVTCLRLKRKIYGVITAIVEENGQTEYEFETWFDSAR